MADFCIITKNIQPSEEGTLTVDGLVYYSPNARALRWGTQVDWNVNAITLESAILDAANNSLGEAGISVSPGNSRIIFGETDVWKNYPPVRFVQANLPAGGSSIIAASNTYSNLVSIPLEPGSWDVDGSLELITGPTTVSFRIRGGISLTSANPDNTSRGGFMIFHPASLAANRIQIFPVSTRRIVLNAPVSVRLVGSFTYTTLGSASWGINSYIRATRIRS